MFRPHPTRLDRVLAGRAKKFLIPKRIFRPEIEKFQKFHVFEQNKEDKMFFEMFFKYNRPFRQGITISALVPTQIYPAGNWTPGAFFFGRGGAEFGIGRVLFLHSWVSDAFDPEPVVPTILCRYHLNDVVIGVFFGILALARVRMEPGARRAGVACTRPPLSGRHGPAHDTAQRTRDVGAVVPSRCNVGPFGGVAAPALVPYLDLQSIRCVASAARMT